MVSVKFIVSPLAKKKYRALFYKNGNIFHISDFGAKGYSDFTIHKDDKRKERYLLRHRSNENWNDPYTNGALSRWILWNKPNLEDSIQDYGKKFKINII